MGIPLPENDKDVAEDPFILLGYGINSFFDLMSQLFWFAIFVTIFFTPLMTEFADQKGLKHEPRYMFNQFSLGNMGGSNIQCSQHGLTVENNTLPHKTTYDYTSFVAECYNGVLSTDKAKFGILSTELDKQTYCRDKAIWNVTSNIGRANCTEYMTPSLIEN